MKRFLKILAVVIVTLIGIFVGQNYPINAEAKPLPHLSDTVNIRKNLELIINTSKPRNYQNTDVLDSLAGGIAGEFLKHTDRVSSQKFTVRNKEYKNIIASFGPENASRIIVGAHYDVCGNQDGADDNASSVAGILELARLLKNKTLTHRIDLVAYSLEEPPFFATQNMGSYVHAKSLHDAQVAVTGMISVEMIGVYSDMEYSQDYPVGMLGWFYGNKGNFITLVQKSNCGEFAKEYKKLAFKNNSILTKSMRAPSFLGGIDLSDHRNYWKFGYSAMMITNTAFYRNHNYHTPQDKLVMLDIVRMGLAIDGIYRTLIDYK